MSAPEWRARREAINIGSAMLVSRVGIARRNAVGRGQCASIVKISRSHAPMPMGNEIESRSKCHPQETYARALR